MEIDRNLALWGVLWVFVAGLVLANRWKKEAAGVGLPSVFLLNLWLIHWPAAVIYLLPWYLEYDIEDNLSLTQAGFQQSTYALIGFALGSLIVYPVLRRALRPGAARNFRAVSDRSIVKTSMVIGLLCFLAQFTFLGRLPTFNALVAAGWNFLVVGLGLSCRRAWQEGKPGLFALWLVIALSFPFVTVVLMGFLGFGTWLFFSIFAFIASFLRPRWKVTALGFLLAYLGLSLYTTYLRDRDAIRAVVWSEEAPLAERIERLYLTVSDFEFFNVFDPLHLYLFDYRLNMNRQVGWAIENLTAGNAEYGYGSTLWWSLVAMIPRALWPGKPVIAGGSEFVASYTRLEYGEGTTVAVGLVMEFYVNFGTWGVILGFLVLGVAVMALDVAAGRRLNKGDLTGFVLWFLPGLGLVKAETSVVELTTTTGAAVVMALLVSWYALRQSQAKKPFLRSGEIQASLLSAQGGVRHSSR